MLNETLTALVEREFQCPVEGQPDLYGLGVRIGIYIQMLAVQVSALLSLVLRQDDYLGESVVVFILAVSSVLIKLIVNKQILAVEAAPMIALLLAQVGSCRFLNNQSLIVGMIYAVEFCGLSALYVWFWWSGMDVLGHSPCADDKVFFFAKVSLWGWFRTMNKVFAVITALVAAITTVMYISTYSALLLTTLFRWIQRLRGRKNEPQSQHNADQRSDTSDSWNVDYGKGFEISVNIGVIAFVEMTLKWNSVTNVHSLRDAGQFMPLMIALAQLLSIIYQGVSKVLHKSLQKDEDGVHGDGDETGCKHENKTKLLRRGKKYEADRDDVELA